MRSTLLAVLFLVLFVGFLVAEGKRSKKEDEETDLDESRNTLMRMEGHRVRRRMFRFKGERGRDNKLVRMALN